jgi:hypothetical protein
MKKIIFSLVSLAMIAMTQVEVSYAQNQGTAINGKQEKVAVRAEDLPEAVKTTLSGDSYAGWQVTSAFLITKEDNSQFFEISIKKGEETATINLDKDGKKVD